jgi:hypothetical protein
MGGMAIRVRNRMAAVKHALPELLIQGPLYLRIRPLQKARFGLPDRVTTLPVRINLGQPICRHPYI